VSNPAHLFDEHLLDDDYQDADIPNSSRHEEGTTASEFDGALDEAEVDDEGEQEIEADESDEASEPKRQKKAKKVRSQHRSFTDHN
jgi:hypothetical protein